MLMFVFILWKLFYYGERAEDVLHEKPTKITELTTITPGTKFLDPTNFS
jgi:hypothetical protein